MKSANRFTPEKVEELFREILARSFPDLSPDVPLRWRKMKFSGYSSPFSGKIYLNLQLINHNGLNKKELSGLIAHELAHQISYRQRGFFGKWAFLWAYLLSSAQRSIVEREADEIAIQRGYGPHLLAERIALEKRFEDNPKMKSLVRRIYMSTEEIRQRIEKSASTPM